MAKKVAISGFDSQVGCSMIAQSIAELLAEKDFKVLLIMASGKFGDDYFSNKDGKSIDHLRANLANGNLSEFELRQELVKEKNFLILPGIRDSLSVEYYDDEILQSFIYFDYDFDYIIIDCGDCLYRGLPLSGMKIADKRYFIGTQQEKSLRRFMNSMNTLIRPLGLPGRIVINKQQSNPALLTLSEIRKITGLELSCKIPYVDYGWQAEIKKSTLLEYKGFRKGVEKLAGDILGVSEDVEEKLFGVFKRRFTKHERKI